MKHPRFKGKPILLGDKVMFQLVDGTDELEAWKPIKVETIIQEDRGLLEPKQPPPYVGAGQWELFKSRKQAERWGYDRSCTGWITGHKPQKG